MREFLIKQEIEKWMKKQNCDIIDDLLNIICEYCRDIFQFYNDSNLYNNSIDIINNNMESTLIYRASNDSRDISVRFCESGIYYDMQGIYSISFKINELSHNCIRFGIMSNVEMPNYNYVGSICGGYFDTINKWQHSMCFDNITGNVIDGKIWRDYSVARIIQTNDILQMIINLNTNIVSFIVYQSKYNFEKNINLGIAFSIQNLRKYGNIHPFLTLMHQNDSVTLIDVNHY